MNDDPGSSSGAKSEDDNKTSKTNGDDDTKLITALQSERDKSAAFEKQAKENSERILQLETQLKKVADVDPEKYQQLLDNQRAIEEETQVKRQEWGNLKGKYEEEKKGLQSENGQLKQTIEQMLIRESLGMAFRQAKGLESIPVPDGIEAVDPLSLIISHFGNRVKLIDKKVVLFDSLSREERNADGKPKTLSEKMQELKKGSLGNLFRADNESSGNGTRQTMTRNDGKTQTVYTREQAATGKADMEAVRRGEAVIV